MIQLEYDRQTAGVRVSFVVSDATLGMMPDGFDLQTFCKPHQNIDGQCIIPQTPTHLKVVRMLLEQVEKNG